MLPYANVPKRKHSVSSRFSRYRGRVLAIVILALIGVIFWYVSSSESWHVQWVEVLGCGRLSPEQVVSASGLGGQWIMTVKPEVAREKVLAIPGVADCTVSRLWTDKVRIIISEEQPLAILSGGEQESWLTITGKVLAPFGEAGDWPVVHLSEGKWQELSSTKELVNGLTYMQAAFPEQKQFEYSIGKGFVLSEGREYPVYLGDAADLPLKLAILSELEKSWRSENKKPQFVDLRTTTAAYYR